MIACCISGSRLQPSAARDVAARPRVRSGVSARASRLRTRVMEQPVSNAEAAAFGFRAAARIARSERGCGLELVAVATVPHQVGPIRPRPRTEMHVRPHTGH